MPTTRQLNFFIALIIGLSFLCRHTTLYGQQQHIIPAPVSYTAREGIFYIANEMRINIPPKQDSIREIAQFFAANLKKEAPYVNISMSKDALEAGSSKKQIIALAIYEKQKESLGYEGYNLDVGQHTIRISANKIAGLFYGMQTLVQLIEPIESNLMAEYSSLKRIQSCYIEDYPRLMWRGLMLDVSRHFFTKEEVMRYIEVMAKYKYNRLQLHLTDDHGWRIEIKSLPKLTQIGAWRVERYGRFGTRKPPELNESATYGGFYTQEDIKELVKFAHRHHVMIIPEIDVPGHSMAALAAYPSLSTKKEKKYVNPGSKFSKWFGDGTFEMIVENMLNPADENVYAFLEKIIDEVSKLFPSPYIHMGGDECYYGYWAKDNACQKFMRKENIKNEHGLQAYFTQRVAEIVASKGKTMIGWDEIMDESPPKNAVIMSWRGMEPGIKAINKNHYAIMSPTTYAYLDYTQGDHSVELPIYANLSLRKAYQFDPSTKEANSTFLLGGQANLWTEHIPTLQHAFYMTYPRAFAIAESLWSQNGQKNWSNFMTRTESHFARFEKEQLSVCKAIYDPIITTTINKKKDSLWCRLSSDLPNSTVYYTINNTYPSLETKSTSTKPIYLPQGKIILRAMTYLNGRPLGRMMQLSRKDLIKRAKKSTH